MPTPISSASCGITVPESDPCINKQTLFKRKSSLKATNNVEDNPTPSPLKQVRWETPDSESTVPLSNALSSLFLTPQDTRHHKERAPSPEKPPKLPLPSGKPAIMALTTHKPARGVESWNDITRANLHHLLRRLSPDYTLAQTPSNPHPPAVAPAEKPLSKSDIRDCAPESTFPNLNPSRHSKISKDSQPPSSGPSLSKGSCDHPVTIGGRKGEQEKVESSRGQEPKDKTSLKISRSSPPTTTQPLISLPNHEHDGRNLQVARRSGKSNHGISWGVTHTSTKRKRDDELDTVDRPAKATRRDDDGERQSVGHAPEAPNTSSLPSEPHIPRQHGQHKSPLSKFGVIQWANQLGSSAYLRNMGKADGKVYNSLIDTLSTIESYKDHRALTLKMLKETKLAVELHKFVDQGSDSPESTLANEIYAHWQSKFCF